MNVNLKITGTCEEMSDLELLKAKLKVFCLEHDLELKEHDNTYDDDKYSAYYNV